MKVLGANLWIAVALLQHVSTAQKEEEDAADTKPFRDHLRRNGKNDEYKYRGQWFTPGPDSTNGDDTTAGTSDVDFKHDNNWWRSFVFGITSGSERDVPPEEARVWKGFQNVYAQEWR